jgi:non-ribosomal peptide synthetase component E (peptide arylation enzyme)
VDVGALTAIDVHTHAEISKDGHGSLSPELFRASEAYFKTQGHRRPTIEETADHYRSRSMAAVVFTVDAEHATGHPRIANEEVAEGCAAHRDVLIPFAYIAGGENVYPAEVESAIFEHPAVAEAAVVGVSDARWGEVGRAFVVPRPGVALDADSVRDFLARRLAKYKIPVHVDVVPALPRTGTGKVRKADLRNRPISG